MKVETGRAVRRRRSDGVRGLSGVLAGGLVALAIAVCVAQALAGASGRPGLAAVVGHAVAALAAVVLQLTADRSRSRAAALASWSVLLLAAAVLWLGWWA